MHNLGFQVIENLYYANSVDLFDEKRLECQKNASIKLKVLDFVCESAKECKCITATQYSNISKDIYEAINLLNGWIKSDNERKIKKV